MARTRAKDHDEKRVAIADMAAIVFAEEGYDRTSMSRLASRCGVSKALLYHYYTSKEAMLYDIIAAHLEELIEAVEAADQPDAAPEMRLEVLVTALLDCYRDADSKHKVQLGTMRFLPEEQQVELKGMERQLVSVFAETIRSINPEAFDGKPLLKPVTMALFGMVNWAYMWFRDGREVTREDYAKIASGILVAGVKAL
ncbi:MAG: TetR/AcrR family transcriptional regulator [Notoacmeibacter sp.]|nr:TetR/AcrR family transcriptional regulator [Notoacmeibacter sp.]